VKGSFGRVRILYNHQKGFTTWTQTKQGLVHCFVIFVDRVDTGSNNVIKYSNQVYSNALLAKKNYWMSINED